MAEGRRKRKRKKQRDSMHSVKPPLDFIESPVEGRKYYCTPVQCARRPFLAPSFPVDDETSAKWVSPQFSCYLEGSDELLKFPGQGKKVRSRSKGMNNNQSDHSLSSHKERLGRLDFDSGQQTAKMEETNSKKSRPSRQSQRIKQKKLKRAHFLFQMPDVTTPVSKEVLAFETPDQELLWLAKREQFRHCTGLLY